MTKDKKNTKIAPTGGCPEPNARTPVLVKGLNALMKISAETPAAINKLTPDPKPHLLTISSIYNINKPPIINCATKTNCILKNALGAKSALGAKPPKNTYIAPSNNIKNIVKIFCNPWK